MSQVCVDTHILIWGVKEQSEPGQEEMIPKAKELLKRCERDGKLILVPSIVVAEFLTGIPPSVHGEVLELLSGWCQIQPFDALCASVFAKLWQEKTALGVVADIRKDNVATRQELKADCMIVSTAVANKSETICTHDTALMRFAQGSVVCRQIPEYPIQGKLAIEIG
ncbi:PIN domain-containing protein [Synechococcus sp. CS-1325]|uniref:type II toxin-antitoxin system VapC family toxin n=1 Tax=Synechococcus sp. CS-1325 TaxID=2847979 RepID=UPI00223B912E|nr:PIN domain-containing protein [Synechococcus sp. CS-1325]MCT0199921.1 PIN domain-containing protein [Synechococcus sp. CS-1325]